MIPKQKNILITIDTCAASETNYRLLEQLTRLYKLASAHNILPYHRKIFLVAPEQILRESAHVHNPILMRHILKAERGGILHTLADSIRNSPLTRYIVAQRDSVANKVGIVRTGYCSGFSIRLSKKVLPATAGIFMDAERLISQEERQDMLNWPETIVPEELETIAEELQMITPDRETAEKNMPRIKEILALVYAVIKDLMEATQDKRLVDFVENPNVLKNLKSPAVIQTLKMFDFWVKRHEGPMKLAHKDCGDFAILQMYTRYLSALYTSHDSWVYLLLSRDDGLLGNISQIYMGSKETENISHTEYPRTSRMYQLRTEMRSNLPVMPMRLHEYYFFIIRCLKEVTGLNLKVDFDDLPNSIAGNAVSLNQWVRDKENKPRKLVECVGSIIDGLATLQRDMLKVGDPKRNSRNSYLDAGLAFSREYINSDQVPGRDAFRPPLDEWHTKLLRTLSIRVQAASR